MKREIDKILKPGETVELVVYPQWRWLSQANIISVLAAVVWLGIIGKLSAVMFSLEKNGEWWTLFLLLVPFWAAGIGMAVSPFWRRKRVDNTLYVVTNRRAIVGQPSPFLLQPETRTWYLEPGLVKSVYAQAAGCGDIVFDYRKVRTKHGWRDEPEGFLSVPELDRVHTLLQELIEAASARPAEPAPAVADPWAQTYLPPVPPRKLASWKWGFFFITPGLICLSVFAMDMHKHAKMAEQGVTTRAVVEYRNRDLLPKLAVSFCDVDGEKYNEVYTIWGNPDFDNYRPGDKVMICYMPDNPYSVALVDHKPDEPLWVGLVLVAIGGCVSLALLRRK